MPTFLSLTAIRIEVPPLDPEMARHTPENGFIVDKVQGWVIAPGGQKSKIAFRYFVQDSERNLQAALLRRERPEGKDAKERIQTRAHLRLFPNFFARAGLWAFPPSRCSWPTGSRIQVDLKQVKDIDSKPALIQRVRLSVSGDPSWTSLSQDPVRAQSHRAPAASSTGSWPKFPRFRFP